MSSPAFVQEFETVWNTNTSPKTAPVFVQAGDVLCIVASSEDDGTTINTPTGGGLTYTLAQSIIVVDFSTLYTWTTTPVASDQSYTLSVTSTGSQFWGFNCLRFSGCSGVGASSKTNVASGAPALNITTTQDNSTVVVANSDWAAVDGVSRVWKANAGVLNEKTYNRVVGQYATYNGCHLDAGVIGTYDVGLTAPGAQKYSIIAVELKGVATETGIPSGVFRRVPAARIIRR